MRHFLKVTAMIISLTMATFLLSNQNLKASAYSVCGLRTQIASFKTNSYLITICPGEASFQLILTYHDGTGYTKIPVEQDGKRYRGSDGKRNYIIDPQQFVIGIDGEQPFRESVIESR